MGPNWQQADVLGVGEVGGEFDLLPPLRACWGRGAGWVSVVAYGGVGGCGGELAAGGCAGGWRGWGRVRSISSAARTLGDGAFPFSLSPSSGHPLHPGVRALGAPMHLYTPMFCCTW